MTATDERLEAATEYVVQRRVCTCGHTILHPTNVQCATCQALFGLAGYIHNGYHYVPRYPIPADEMRFRPQWQRGMIKLRRPSRARMGQGPRVQLVCARCGEIAWRGTKSRHVCGACVQAMHVRRLRWCSKGNHETRDRIGSRHGGCRECCRKYGRKYSRKAHARVRRYA